MKLTRELVVYSIALSGLFVFLMLIASGVFESKWTQGTPSDSSVVRLDGLSVQVAREYLDTEDQFHVILAIENRSRGSAWLGTWTNLRLENRQGKICDPVEPPPLPEALKAVEKFETDLTFPAQAPATFPLMIEFSETSLCNRDDHSGEIRFILDGHGIRSVWGGPSSPATSHQHGAANHDGSRR